MPVTGPELRLQPVFADVAAVGGGFGLLCLLRTCRAVGFPRRGSMVNGQQPETVAKRFSKYVNPKDLVVWAHDYERMGEAEFLAKYGAAPRRSRSSAAAARPALSLRDTATAARNEEQRLTGLERQLGEQLAAVRREKKDVEELLGFSERKIGAEGPI